MLIGVGLSCTVQCLRSNPYHIGEQGFTQLVVSGGFLLTSLLSSAIVVPMNLFTLGKKYGLYLCGLYAVFMVVSITLEFVHVKIR